MPIQLISANIGELQTIPGARVQTPTGIFKVPAKGPVAVGIDGLEGDKSGSKKFHGGPDQAICIYSAEDYAWWEATLQRDLPPGTFGENLTVTTMGESPARVGDLWRIGEVTLELSSPRVPCATLAARMNLPTFVKAFARANRGGAYARVLVPGRLEAGDRVSTTPTTDENPTIDELFAMFHTREKDPELLKRALASPLASLARADVTKWLERLTARAI